MRARGIASTSPQACIPTFPTPPRVDSARLQPLATEVIHHESGFDQLKAFRMRLLVGGEWEIQVKIDEEVGTLVNPRKIQLAAKRGGYPVWNRGVVNIRRRLSRQRWSEQELGR